MTDRVVVLHADDALSFVADGCVALADAVNETRLVSDSRQGLVDSYAEMVVALARLMRPQLLGEGETVRVAVIDHLIERLGQARTGEFPTPVLDIVDRLHGELVRELARA